MSQKVECKYCGKAKNKKDMYQGKYCNEDCKWDKDTQVMALRDKD